jgi:hypothetical protein
MADKSREDIERAHDLAWAKYMRARARMMLDRSSFRKQQAFLETSEAVARTVKKLGAWDYNEGRRIADDQARQKRDAHWAAAATNHGRHTR